MTEIPGVPSGNYTLAVDAKSPQDVRGSVEVYRASVGWSNFWLFTACLLVATLRQDRVPLDVSEPSYKAMVETLLDRLR